MLTINCDGGSRGNPGPAASACVVTKDGLEIYKEGKFLGETTNNIAEYNGVLLGINYLHNSNTAGDVVFILDSLLVVNQLMGKFKINNPTLLSLFNEVNSKSKELQCKVVYTYVPREKNKEADKLVNITLDENQ